MNNNQDIESKAKRLWGDDLHKNNSGPFHCFQLEEIFKEKWRDALKGDLLEIGCGAGSDLEFFSKLKKIKTITAIDLGENVIKLSEKYIARKDITITKGNALSLEFDSNKFDVIYSFGVFHHTNSPIKCISNAKRVLKKNGSLFFYVYSSHQGSLFKRTGVFLEKKIMKFFRYIPYSLQNAICIFLSPFCWMAFSVPSKFLEFIGIKDLSKKFPFNNGKHPFSLILDLKDRLMSPINHRFTKLEIERKLDSINFCFFEVVEMSSGLYIHAIK